MRLPLQIGVALGCLLPYVANGAQASEAGLVAERAGFLLGHAHRCGVEQTRLERSAARMVELIAAFASDQDEKEIAQKRFTTRILAGALAQQLGDRLASCRMVRAELAQLEHHLRPAAASAKDATAREAAPNNRLAANPWSGGKAEVKPTRSSGMQPAGSHLSLRVVSRFEAIGYRKRMRRPPV